MPANTKHLTKSPWQRFAKITAAIIGGFILSISVHLAAALWFDHVTVLITSTFSGFILWAALMIIAFLGKNGWKIWVIYLLLTGMFALAIYFGKIYSPVTT